MKLNSRLKTAGKPMQFRAWLLAGAAALMGVPHAAAAQAGQPPLPQERTITIGNAPLATAAQQRLNPTGRTITLTVPAKDGALYLGDIVLTIDANDRVSFASARALDLLSNIMAPTALETIRANLAGETPITPQDLSRVGVLTTYNPQTLELVFEIPSQFRAAQGVSIAPLDRMRLGDYSQPARFSAYLNARANLDYVHKGANEGLGDPIVYLDFASRLNGVVLETQGVWSPGADTEFQRQGSRLVYDDLKNVVRWAAGDLLPVSRSYQAAPSMAGVSFQRSYSALQPQLISRPRGSRSFALTRPSVVEVYINGQSVRRLQLQPGNYNLSDFPFTQGANDVRLAIIDDTGRTEVLRFNIFFDQSQLAAGLSEFGFYAGVKSELQADGPDYTDDWVVSGFYRRGLDDNVTVGANFQADSISQMVGAETVLGTDIGVFGAQFAISNLDVFGAGFSGALTYQRVIQRPGGQADAVNLSFEYRSEDFGPVGTLLPVNPFAFELAGGYTHAFSDDIYAGIDFRHSIGRDLQEDVSNVRTTFGWRLTANANLTADVIYEDGILGRNTAGLLSLTYRIGRYSSARAEYDTRDDRARVGFQTLRGQGVGSYNAAVDLERADYGSGFNANLNYIANRAEIGMSHFGTFEDMFGSALDERTSLRLGGSLAIADGAAALGRPIYDSFAMVRGHRTLDGAAVEVQPTPEGYLAASGVLGAGVAPNLASYTDQTIAIDAPDAEIGADLGQGSFKLYPPYRSGYLLTVGSDYYVSALGVMLDADGAPLSMVSGTAYEVGAEGKEPVTVFTNKVGRFSLNGLRPGRWEIRMLGDEPATYVIDVPENAENVIRFDALRPSGEEK